MMGGHEEAPGLTADERAEWEWRLFVAHSLRAELSDPREDIYDSADDETGDPESWEKAVARDWAADRRDPREDIYTLDDGKPLDTLIAEQAQSSAFLSIPKPRLPEARG
jgi:hypothetical protein